MNQFLQRLTRLLDGRRIHPWATGLGISKGAAETMSRGQVPGAEILRLIRLHEGVNLGWLISGDGAPFVVQQIDSTDQLIATLQGDSHPEGMLHLCSDGQQLVLLTEHPGQLVYRQRSLPCLFRRLIQPPQGLQPGASLLSAIGQYSMVYHGLEPAKLQALSLGELSPRQASMLPVMPLPPLEKLLQTPGNSEPDLLCPRLMRAVIEEVEHCTLQLQQSINPSQRAQLYSAAYRHAVRRDMAPDQLDSSQILSLVEML